MKNMIRASVIAAMLATTAAAYAVPPFTPSDFSEVGDWNGYAKSSAGRVADALLANEATAAQQKAFYVRPGKTPFEQAFATALSGKLVEKGFKVVTAATPNSFSVEIKSKLMGKLNAKNYQTGEYTAKSFLGALLNDLLMYSNPIPYQIVGTGVLADVYNVFFNTPEDAKHLMVGVAVTEGVELKAAFIDGFMVKKEMQSFFKADNSQLVRTVEVK